MDLTPEYTRMCEKAYPDLGPKEPEDWDYWYLSDAGRCIYSESPVLAVRVINGYDNDAGIYGPGTDCVNYGYILICPVWRQDQLQAMLEEKRPFALVVALEDAISEGPAYQPYYMQFASMEQVWLAYVMDEKFDKKWTGIDWAPEKMEPPQPTAVDVVSFRRRNCDGCRYWSEYDPSVPAWSIDLCTHTNHPAPVAGRCPEHAGNDGQNPTY